MADERGAAEMLDKELRKLMPGEVWRTCCDSTNATYHRLDCQHLETIEEARYFAPAEVEALRCHDVWPLLEAWARAERELQAANESFTTSVDVDKASTAPVSCSEPGLRVKAAAKRLDETTAALLAAVPEEAS